MLLPIAALALAQVQPNTSPPPSDDIVVVARRRACEVRLADKILSDAEFRARAREWAAGKPVRVFANDDASIQCRAKIAFKLGDWGVRLIQFVDPAHPRTTTAVPASAAPPVAGIEPTFVDSGNSVVLNKTERDLNAGRAAILISLGKCAEARQLVLKAGDLDAAYKVVEVCRDPATPGSRR